VHVAIVPAKIDRLRYLGYAWGCTWGLCIHDDQLEIGWLLDWQVGGFGRLWELWHHRGRRKKLLGTAIWSSIAFKVDTEEAQMRPLDLVKLTPLMKRTSGRAKIMVAVIDGPIAVAHPDFSGVRIHEVSGPLGATCARAESAACRHGTFVAGILSAHRASPAPAICPNCTLLVRPIFRETSSINGDMPSATPEELAAAIVEIVDAGAHVVNLSAALAQPSPKGERALEQALDYAAHGGGEPG
jgi:subtilisin family serine protease